MSGWRRKATLTGAGLALLLAVAALVAHAREAYLGKAKDDWQVRQRKARQVADHLGKRVAAML